jgi:hypothetical protein
MGDIIDDHMRVQPPSNFGTIPPPKYEDYMPTLALRSQIMMASSDMAEHANMAV